MSTVPVCSVKLAGTPDVDLSYKGGDITIDEAAAPLVQGIIRIARPATVAGLAALDPRLGVRIKTKVITTGLLGQVTREFNLGLRRRPGRLVAGEVQLEVASDEALLNDYAPLVDDLTPFTYQTSLRALVGYLLGKIGATLEASPAGDASAQTYADSVNLLTDPRYAGTAGGGYAVTACTATADTTYPGEAGLRGLNLSAPTNNDSYMSLSNGGELPYGMQPGRTYVFSAEASVRTVLSGTLFAGRDRRLCVFTRKNSTDAYAQVSSPQVPNVAQTGGTAGGAGTRVSVVFTVPTDATAGVMLRPYLGATAGSITWTKFRLSEYTGDPTDIAFYSGATAATTGYTYAWTGAADLSTTKRTPLLTRPVDAMRWPAGKKAMEWIIPIVQAAGFRLLCDEARKWTLRPMGYVAAGALAFRAEVNIQDSTETLQRGGDWFDAQVTEYTWIDPATGTRKTVIDSWALTTPPTLVNRVTLTDQPYPGPGRSEYAVRRAQQRGRELVITAPADWTATAEQLMSAILDGLPIQTGKTSRVQFSLDRDEMTVITRTVDTPAGAIDLAVGTIDGGSAGTIDTDI